MLFVIHKCANLVLKAMHCNLIFYVWSDKWTLHKAKYSGYFIQNSSKSFVNHSTSNCIILTYNQNTVFTNCYKVRMWESRQQLRYFSFVSKNSQKTSSQFETLFLEMPSIFYSQISYARILTMQKRIFAADGCRLMRETNSHFIQNIIMVVCYCCYTSQFLLVSHHHFPQITFFVSSITCIMNTTCRVTKLCPNLCTTTTLVITI